MKLHFRSLTTAVLCATLVTGAALAGSHSAEGNKAVQARKALMGMVGYHTGLLGAIAKGEMPYDAAIVNASAANIQALAAMERATLWIEGTEQGAVPDSRAKAEIWGNPDDFGAKFADLEKAAAAISGATDAAAVGAAMGPLGGTCKSCHETYRGPEN